MRFTRNLPFLAVLAAFMVMSVACTQQRAAAPDVAGQIKDSLKANHLDAVKVNEDRDKGVVTLSGDVKSDQEKSQAEDIAKQNAGGLIVANELGVRPAGEEGAANKVDKNLDKGIEDDYRAALTSKGMDNQHIHCSSKNAVVTLTGDVDTPTQRQSAEKIAAQIPNVSQVVNELTVKGAKKTHQATPSGK